MLLLLFSVMKRCFCFFYNYYQKLDSLARRLFDVVSLRQETFRISYQGSCSEKARSMKLQTIVVWIYITCKFEKIYYKLTS